MKRVIIITILLCMVLQNFVFAQRGSISVTVVSGAAAIDAATVSLLQAGDASWLKSDITNDKGQAQFSSVAAGKYRVTVTAVGFKPGEKEVEVADGKETVCSIDLEKEVTAMSEVAVTAKKPFIEMSLGKTIVNVESSTATGASNALDLMRRLPGITVNQNESIAMRGKEGLLVLIDDRPTYLSDEDLAAYLKTITADDIKQIELITQPDARYDAAGNTGVVNIKLKKNRKEGLNGNVMVGYGLGVYFHRNESALLNYKRNKLGLSVSFSDMEAIGFADWKQNFNYLDPMGNVTSRTVTHSFAKERFGNQALRVTADYSWTDNTTIGINVRGTYHPNTMHSDIHSSNTAVNNDVIYNSIATAEGFIRKDLTTNAYLLEKFNKQSTLEVNVDYLTFSKRAYEDFINTTYDNQMQALPNPLIFNMKEPSTVNVYSFKADHSYTIKNGMKLESGLKSSWVKNSDDVNFRLYENAGWVTDTGKTNQFLYKENINAGYITVTKTINSKWDARVGLRAEQTNVQGIQQVHNDRFERKYFSLFPTAFLTYKHDSDNQFELNYGRRIERPAYKDLNPFVYYAFQNNFVVGNPHLQPQYTDNIELKHSYKNMIVTTLSYSGTRHVFHYYLKINDTTREVYSMQNNIAAFDGLFMDIAFNKDVFKWWTLNLSGSIFYAEFRGEINNERKIADQTGGALSMNTQFNFSRGWKAEAYLSYVSKGRWSLTTTFDPNIYIGVGASKKVNDHFLVKFYSNDPLNIYWNRVMDHSYNYSSDSKYRNSSQLFSLSVIYNFGNKIASERNAKSLDEADRVK